MDYKAASIEGATQLAAAQESANANATAQALPAPDQAQTLKVQVAPGDIILIGFDPGLAIAILQNGDLVLIFQNGGRIVLEHFATAAVTDSTTAVQLPSGITVAGDAIVAQLSEEGPYLPLETAAGDAGQLPPVSSGGGLFEASLSGPTLGEAVELVEALVVGGVLPSTSIGFISLRQTAERQVANADNILLVDGVGSAGSGAAGGAPSVPPAGVAAADRPESPFGTDPVTGFVNSEFSQTGTDGDDVLNGLALSELLVGLAGNDTLLGNGGDDVLNGGPGADLLDGGVGNDTATYLGSDAAVAVSLADGTAAGGDAEGDTLTNVENLTGSDFDDTLTGDEGDNTLQGGLGADVLDGRGGSDTASYVGSLAPGVTVNLEAGTTGGSAAGDLLIDIENIIGSGHGDTLIGDSEDNRIAGRGGGDTLIGGAGDDLLNGGNDSDLLLGGAGNDVLIGGKGDDIIDGGAGIDTLDYSIIFPFDDDQVRANPEGVFVDLLFGIATGGQIGSDTISGIEIVLGSAADDLMLGDDGLSTTFDGGEGVDSYSVSLSQFSVTIDLETGLAQGINVGTDVIRNFENATGGTVGDTIRGTSGDNMIRGLAGADILTGRDGADSFLYSAGDGGNSLALADIITDFADGSDQIVLLNGLVFGAAAGQAQFVAADSLGLGGAADDSALVITDGAGAVTEVLAVIDSLAVGALDQNDVVTA